MIGRALRRRRHLHLKKANVIHTGDVFFSAGYPYIDITNGGSIDGMIAAAERVLALAKGTGVSADQFVALVCKSLPRA